jgi:metal-responsive CopG/Arc/MetJ family transcriptional regulator
MRRNEYMRNARAMKEYLLNAGYTQQAIEDYIEEKSAVQKNNMQKGIIALFFRNSEFKVVPRALNAWKDYVL